MLSFYDVATDEELDSAADELTFLVGFILAARIRRAVERAVEAAGDGTLRLARAPQLDVAGIEEDVEFAHGYVTGQMADRADEFAAGLPVDAVTVDRPEARVGFGEAAAAVLAAFVASQLNRNPSVAVSELTDAANDRLIRVELRAWARDNLQADANRMAASLARKIDPTAVKTWHTVGDEKVRHTHAVLDGEQVPVKDPFEVGGYAAQVPADPALPAKERKSCRCWLTFTSAIASFSISSGRPLMPNSPDISIPAPVITASWKIVTSDGTTITNGDPGEFMSGGQIVLPPSVVASGTRPAPTEPSEEAAAQLDSLVASGATFAAVVEGGVAFWRGILVVEGAPTGDRRRFEVGALTVADLPLPLMAMTRNPDGGWGHDAADLVGNITATNYVEGTIPEWWGEGYINVGDPAGARAYQLVADGFLRGISIDPDSIIYNADASEDEDMDVFAGGRIRGATLTPFPAFVEAKVTEIGDVEVAGAAAEDDEEDADDPVDDTADEDADELTTEGVPALVASAGFQVEAPDAPPAAWFADPGFHTYSPITVTQEGRVFGHVADWSSCHIGIPGCVTAPRSHNGNARFHTGQVRTGEGADVRVGRLTLDTVHPDLRLNASDAEAFYADTGSCVADVVIGEDEHGIWMSGALRPELSARQIRALRNTDVSPDWRLIDGNLEIVGLLCVNVSGFPALAASGGRQRVYAEDSASGPASMILMPAPMAKAEDCSCRSTASTSHEIAVGVDVDEELMAELRELADRMDAAAAMIERERADRARARILGTR
ncbi:MAG: phage minor head protein [Actinomycetota bacterium]